ncbi:transcription cofactor vestigial-like protein 1 [Rhinophrynus dorsalis]
MEDLRKSSLDYNTKDQPVKTELGSRCVVFTYYQGDINSVVDEHFSRALRNTKDPQDLSTKSRGDDYSKNMSHMATEDLHWMKSYHTPNSVRMASPVLAQLPPTSDHYPSAVYQTHHPQPADVWHFHHIGPHSPVGPVYQHSLPEFQMVPGTGPDGKSGSLLQLLQHERYPVHLQESVIKQEPPTSTATGPSGPENLDQRMNSQAGLHPQDRRKDYFHPQDRRKDLYFY